MNDRRTVQLIVHLNKTDIKDYVKYYYRKSLFLQIISFIGFILLFALLVNVLIPDNTISFLTGLDPFIFIFGALIITLPFIIYYLLIKTAKKSDLFSQRIYTIAQDTISVEMGAKEISFPVNSLTKISETKSTFYLWQQKAPMILPKRFMSESDIEFIRNINSQLKSLI